MAKKKTSGERPEQGELVESDFRPSTFVPDPMDVSKSRQVGPIAVDMTDFEGEWYKQDEPPDSEPYGRKLVPDDQYGHTHHFKNQDHFCSCTPEQAKVQFSKTPPEEAGSEEEPPAV